VISSVWSLSEGGQTGVRADGQTGWSGSLAVSGPGIRETARIEVDGFSAEARKVFAERNAAPPLGLDLVLVAPDGSVVSLGRYTRIQEE
jgi:alpha-D-ribose 1-methylphosphonate 5-triphosphate synthase subunit PhnH